MATADHSSGRSLRRDSAANRVRLITAASRVFGEHGTDTSLEQVAREAGLGMATLYRRFPTKEGLIREVVGAILEYIVEVARREVASSDGLGLERWLWVYADLQARKRGLLAHLLRDDASTRALHRELMSLLEQLVATARTRGTVRADVAVSDVVLIIFAVRGVTESIKYGDTQSWRRHLALALAGLKTPRVELNEFSDVYEGMTEL